MKFGRRLNDLEARRFPTMCARRVLLNNARDVADSLAAALEENFDARLEVIDGGLHWVSAPFTDVVLECGDRGLKDLAGKVRQRLRLMYGQFAADFRVAVHYDDGLDPGKIRAYFGRGVFVPEGARLVADLEFAGRDPVVDPNAPRVTPTLGLGGRDPAGWYEGQMGLAVAFGPGLAAAVAPVERLGADWQALESLVLFFGRESESETPKIISLEDDSVGPRATPMPQNPTHWHIATKDVREKRYWQYISIAGRQLWFRFVDRTGASPFLTSPPRGNLEGKMGAIRVHGLALPRISAFARAGAKSWRVEFDEDGRLRHSEAASLRHVVYARYSALALDWRAAVYNYADHDYAQAGGIYTGSLSLGGARRLEIRELQPATLLGTRKGEEYGALVRMFESEDSAARGAVVLTGEDDKPLGWTLVAQGRFISVTRDPIIAGVLASATADPPISLDWVNRSAKVLTTRWRGLAEFWLADWDLELRAKEEALEVKVTNNKKAKATSFAYSVKTGDFGLVGPLWIEYQGSRPS